MGGLRFLVTHGEGRAFRPSLCVSISHREVRVDPRGSEQTEGRGDRDQVCPEHEPPRSARPPSPPPPGRRAQRRSRPAGGSPRSGSEGAQRPESLGGREHGASLGRGDTGAHMPPCRTLTPVVLRPAPSRCVPNSPSICVLMLTDEMSGERIRSWFRRPLNIEDFGKWKWVGGERGVMSQLRIGSFWRPAPNFSSSELPASIHEEALGVVHFADTGGHSSPLQCGGRK
jgi:hypothetical protein